jgi:hypothetical protein
VTEFDWAKITWGRPDSPPTVLCSYCAAALAEGDGPLILWTGDGHSARFCPACSELVAAASLGERYRRAGQPKVEEKRNADKPA